MHNVCKLWHNKHQREAKNCAADWVENAGERKVRKLPY